MLRIPEQDGTFDKALLSYSESTGESHSYVNPAVWDSPAEAGRVMWCNPRGRSRYPLHRGIPRISLISSACGGIIQLANITSLRL